MSFHSSYLLTNFRLSFIQVRDNVTVNAAHHFKDKVRYYEGTGDGLIESNRRCTSVSISLDDGGGGLTPKRRSVVTFITMKVSLWWMRR